MLILRDNDVVGAVAVLRRIVRSTGWLEFAEELRLKFATLGDLGLLPSSTDREVWQAAQAAEAILVTANRAGGEGSLDWVIDTLSGPESLPVMTLTNPQRILLDRAYALSAAVSLLDSLDRIDSLRGVGRLYIP